MSRRLMIVILAGMVFAGIFASTILAGTPGKITPERIPLDQIVPSSPTPLTGDKGFCLIQSDSLTQLLWYSVDFEAGDGFVLYMDPAKCGLPDPYPFKITDVHFYIYGWTGENPPVWPVEIQVNIWDLNGGVKCNGPGNLLCSQTFTIPIDSSFDSLSRPMNLKIDSLWCAYNPFFLEIKYTSGTGPPYPRLVMTDITDPPDTCDAWFLWHEDGNYYEWYNTWDAPVPGYPIMRITGYTQQCYPFIYGDANGDGVIDISDVVYLINYLFIHGPAPVPLAAGDANCDAVVDVSDVVYLINYLFVGGPAPCK
jgi:hypothetical protein